MARALRAERLRVTSREAVTGLSQPLLPGPRAPAGGAAQGPGPLLSRRGTRSHSEPLATRPPAGFHEISSSSGCVWRPRWCVAWAGEGMRSLMTAGNTMATESFQGRTAVGDTRRARHT